LSAATIPLAALRADLDDGWPPGARWITTGGVSGAILEQPVGSRLSFPLRAGGQKLRLRGRVEIGGEKRGPARVRVRVATIDRAGVETLLWSGGQRRLGRRRHSSDARLDASFEILGSADLIFSSIGPEGERVLWSELEILVDGTTAGDAPELAPSPPAPLRPAAEGHGEGERRQPLFSVLTPVHNPPLAILEETIGSVLAQSCEDWELCLVDDGSTDPQVRETLRRSVAADPRIRMLRRETAGGIATATNAALEMARGEYVALLDHDDVLLPDALAHVAAVLRERPETDMLYSDEELFEVGAPTHTFAKPHWSPDLLRSQMYTCHLGVYRRSLAEAIGGFRTEFDGSQDYDFALRLTERTNRVVHIPRVLYRWRAHAGSTAGSAQAKPAAYPAARRAIAEHLERMGVDAEVHFGHWQGIYRVVHRLPPDARIAVGIVGDPSEEEVKELIEAVEDEATSGVSDARIVVADDVRTAAQECADADAIVLCEGAVEPLTRFWLARLAGFALQPGVAAVGARTLAPDGRVEHGGIAIEAGLPVPIMFSDGAGDPGPLGIGLLPANVAAVAGLVAFAAEVLHQLGGLEAELGELAVADYCLRGLSAGMRVVSAPDVLVRRSGRPGAANDLQALASFQRRWSSEFATDPYFDLSVGWPGVETVPTGSG
jgi:O-antigen biosynthesis protein